MFQSLGLCCSRWPLLCGTQAFSSCSKQSYSLVVAFRLLSLLREGSVVVEGGEGVVSLHRWYLSTPTRDGNCCPRHWKESLNHWTSVKVHESLAYLKDKD